MKKFKGTPGPWTTVQEYADELTVVDAEGFEIVTAERTAILQGCGAKGFGHWGDEGGSKNLSGQEQFANANLIAAAPELLELVISANLGVTGSHTAAWQEKAQAVIAKALGESQ